ncbi:hypothetical protein KP77_13930 [Jeotgalibacillus alimentarius]|uniref:Uncharacterized protein n=1 Tax=Jeotgalibacillus alimentarius TaxID=135826 RepID=A0A0C2W3Y3_9BACL|nr:hypothetical protein [Jeotgalibacillus alimentarius]KIL50773.1 hypothetical protein KP77_13930 [Jeotgalibacillus alimentarius]
MAYMTSVLLGFSALIGLVGAALMYFLRIPLNSKDAERIDPRPENNEY